VAGTGRADRLLVRAAAGVPAPVSRAAVEAALRAYPLTRVDSRADGRARLTRSLDEQLGVFAALLGIAVLIGLCGVANTMSLSVVERTWESALLRALGLSRRRLRAMLVLEALFMAVVGAFVGVGLGAGVGAAASVGLIRAYGHGVPEIPLAQLALYAGLAAVAAALAAVLPARRAARAPVVEGLWGESPGV
jgi:putative ABC transport system permease protein